MAERDLIVKFIGDDRDLQRAFVRGERGASQFQSRFTKLNQSLRGGIFGSGLAGRGALLFGSGAFIGTASITAALTKSVTAASDLNEQISRTEVIFGEAAQATVDWSTTTAASIGISQRAALAASATFAGLFQTVGVGQEKAGELSQSLVQLAADLASLQNSSPEEALIALRSGLAGEAEPLRRFNIFLTETRVQQEALAQTGKRLTSELTQQEKTLARYSLILRDSLPAQGNFSDTQGELANQSRILRAQFDDLSANMGSVLIPVLTDAAEAANLLFAALNQMRGVDFSPGFDFPDPPDFLRAFALAPISPLGATALGVKRLLDDDDKKLKSVTDQVSSSVDSALGGLEDALGKRKEKLDRITAKESRDQQKRFAAMVLGLGLKLDKARLTTTFSDDILALRELEAAILRQIQSEGKTFKLIQQLTNTRLAITGLLEQQSAAATQAASDAFNDVMDALSLDLEVAQTTKSLQDDQKALRAIEQALLDRISSEGRTTDLLRQLLQVRQQQAEVARQLVEQRRERRQSDQFKSLGLTEEGEKPTPGSGSLLRRARSLQDQIKGTTLDTQQTRNQLQRIIDTLKKNFKTAGKEVRSAILEMLNDISSALEGDSDRTGGEITAGGIRPLRRLIAGLNLTEEQIAQLERNMQRRRSGRPINAFGVDFDGGMSNAISNVRGFPGVGDFGPPNIFVTVEIDGQKVTGVVKKELQKTGKRRTNRRGGAGAGRGAIL